MFGPMVSYSSLNLLNTFGPMVSAFIRSFSEHVWANGELFSFNFLNMFGLMVSYFPLIFWTCLKG
jgi:hypothetical protein